MELQFEDKNHKYSSINDPDKKWTSVTTLISLFEEPFIQEDIAKRCSKNKKSKWYGIEPEKIIEYWDKESERANTLGTWYHNQREQELISCETLRKEGLDLPIFAPIVDGNKKISPNQVLVPGIYPEHFMYLKSLGICGQSDRVEVIGNRVDISDYKGLPLDTDIPTKSGFVKMKDIKIGDVVFDGNGELTEVDAVSEIHHNPCYKLKFDNNDEIICDHEHRWVVKFRKSNKTYTEKIMTAEQLFELRTTVKQTSYTRIHIENAKSLNLPDCELPINPYLLGAWLGDGSKIAGYITNIDDRFWNELKKRNFDIGLNTAFGNRADSRTIYKLRTQLRKLNLLNNKHIPDIYLRASHSQRLDLLRGIMDTDGYFNESRQRFVMATTQKWQADAVMELISSLGWKPTLIRAKKYLNGNVYKGYDVCFRSDENPFLIRNQDCLMKMKPSSTISKFRTVVSIEKTDMVPTKCITVKSNTHTYLATRHYIKTHNTYKKIETRSYVNWEGKAKMMLPPLDTIEDCKLMHGALQLSIYMYIILKHNPQLVPGKLTIQHVTFEVEREDEFSFPITKIDSDGNYVIKEVVNYEVPYLKQEVQNLMKYIQANPQILNK